MTPNDPIAALADELAACGEQLTRLDAREAAHYTALTALLTGLTARPAPAEDPGGYQPGPPPPWRKLTPEDRQRARRPAAPPGSSRSTSPATATWPPPWAPAGPPTTCACTAWTSRPSCGPSCTCSPAAPRGC